MANVNASKNGRQFDAVIFDLDGTLADTIPLIAVSFNAAVRPVAGRDFTLEEVIAKFGLPDSAMLRREVGDERWEEVNERYHQNYKALHSMVRVFDGVQEMLDALVAADVPMGIMTGKGRRTADITLNALTWDMYFGAVITGDEAVRPKPAPDGPLEVARMLGVEAGRCAFVGDAPADIKAGRAAGMTMIAAGWHSVYREKVRALRPDVWAERPGEVVEFVLGK
jgi:phosphoglycolate phosphatase/pyrophosphatase PpaX